MAVESHLSPFYPRDLVCPCPSAPFSLRNVSGGPLVSVCGVCWLAQRPLCGCGVTLIGKACPRVDTLEVFLVLHEPLSAPAQCVSKSGPLARVCVFVILISIAQCPHRGPTWPPGYHLVECPSPWPHHVPQSGRQHGRSPWRYSVVLL